MLLMEELEQILGPQGAIAANHPLYEHRPGQIAMAQAIADAVEQNRHLCVEAGTGTGKTLAYLLPVIFSNKRVVISTATKNLQEQLFYKDIPFLVVLVFVSRSTDDFDHRIHNFGRTVFRRDLSPAINQILLF